MAGSIVLIYSVLFSQDHGPQILSGFIIS